MMDVMIMNMSEHFKKVLHEGFLKSGSGRNRSRKKGVTSLENSALLSSEFANAEYSFLEFHPVSVVMPSLVVASFLSELYRDPVRPINPLTRKFLFLKGYEAGHRTCHVSADLYTCLLRLVDIFCEAVGLLTRKWRVTSNIEG